MSSNAKCESRSIKDEKYGLHKQFYSPTVRLTISLTEPDEESCSVFNYMSLLNEEKRNRRRERERRVGTCPAEENDELDNDIKQLSQYFEEKYATTTAKKKKKKKAPTFYNYSELASGYDENDSFIDNSEAFDEALPDEMETFHGGYYVNCGQLEFKKMETLEENSDPEENKIGKKKNCVLKSDDSNNNRESSRSELDIVESDEEDADSVFKKLPEENENKETENESDKSNTTESTKINDKLIFSKSKKNSDNFHSVNGNVLKRKRKKYKKRRFVETGVHDDYFSKPKKKALTVKLLLEEKRITENGENNDSSVKIGENFHNSINDIIESVVNAARNQSEDSRDSISLSSDTKSIDSRTSYETEKESHAEESEVTEPVGSDSVFSSISKDQIKIDNLQLNHLPSEMVDLVSQVKNSSENSNLSCKRFLPQTNSKLLSDNVMPPLLDKYVIGKQITDEKSQMEKSPIINNVNVVNENKSKNSICNNDLTTTTTSISKNYDVLTNSSTLQTHSKQHTFQSDVYPTACSADISFYSDPVVMSATSLSLQATSLPSLVNKLPQVAVTTNQYASNHTYSKSVSPLKKQIVLPSLLTSQSSSTILSSGQYPDNKKINDAINLNYSDICKIDSSISTQKMKKEHHMLNHISQYNKHYSHKNEKKKKVTNIKKECYVSDRNCTDRNYFYSNTSNSNNNNNNNSNGVNNGNSTSSSNSINNSSKQNPGKKCLDVICNPSSENANYNKTDEALDLSPSKIISQDETKFDNSIHVTSDSNFNLKNDISTSVVSNATAKDHNYWASRKEETENKDINKQNATATCLPSSECVNCNVNANSKTAHISRKHRILQESAKSVSCEKEKSCLLDKTKSLENISLIDPVESFYKGHEVQRLGNTSLKHYEEKLIIVHDENQMLQETVAATDILSKIISDTLQDSPHSLQRQHIDNIEISSKVEIKSTEISNNKTEMELLLPKRETEGMLLNKSICTSNTERKASLTNHAEMEAAEVINDLLVLNQIGGHSISRRMDYQDTSRYNDSKNTNELNSTSGSILNQSSHLSSDIVKSSIPRMNLTGFQDEFFKHIFKMDRGNS